MPHLVCAKSVVPSSGPRCGTPSTLWYWPLCGARYKTYVRPNKARHRREECASCERAAVKTPSDTRPAGYNEESCSVTSKQIITAAGRLFLRRPRRSLGSYIEWCLNPRLRWVAVHYSAPMVSAAVENSSRPVALWHICPCKPLMGPPARPICQQNIRGFCQCPSRKRERPPKSDSA